MLTFPPFLPATDYIDIYISNMRVTDEGRRSRGDEDEGRGGRADEDEGRESRDEDEGRGSRGDEDENGGVGVLVVDTGLSKLAHLTFTTLGFEKLYS